MSKQRVIFCEFNPRAIGAASIGQAHIARLNTEKREKVCVKFQYPDMHRLFKYDLRAIRLLRAYITTAKRECALIDNYCL